MPRGQRQTARPGLQSKSTPSLPTLGSLTTTRQGVDSAILPGDLTSPPEPAAIDDYRPTLGIVHSPAPSIHHGSEEEDEDVPIALPSRQMYTHHFSRSHTSLGPNAFAPPFYNRPPTPLPPSPSLTSLLRPSFSSYNSRPTTPDVSSDEGGALQSRSITTGTQTPNSTVVSSLTNSFRTANPVPRASPKVPTYEYYGFTLYLSSSLAFIVYLLWSFLPSPFLHSLGIYYFPDRWWALAIPAWTVMFIVYIYVALAAYNTGHLTLPLQNVECVVDEAANIAVVDADGRIIRDRDASWRSPSPAQGRRSGQPKRGAQSRQSSLSRVQQLRPELEWRTLWNEGTDAVMDIPIGGICEILYGGSND